MEALMTKWNTKVENVSEKIERFLLLKSTFKPSFLQETGDLGLLYEVNTRYGHLICLSYLADVYSVRVVKVNPVWLELGDQLDTDLFETLGTVYFERLQEAEKFVRKLIKISMEKWE